MAVVNGGDSQLNAGNTVNASSGDSSLQGVRVSDGWKDDVQRYRQSRYSSPLSYGDGYDDYANSYRFATITQDDEVDPDGMVYRVYDPSTGRTVEFGNEFNAMRYQKELNDKLAKQHEAEQKQKAEEREKLRLKRMAEKDAEIMFNKNATADDVFGLAAPILALLLFVLSFGSIALNSDYNSAFTPSANPNVVKPVVDTTPKLYLDGNQVMTIENNNLMLNGKSVLSGVENCLGYATGKCSRYKYDSGSYSVPCSNTHTDKDGNEYTTSSDSCTFYHDKAYVVIGGGKSWLVDSRGNVQEFTPGITRCKPNGGVGDGCMHDGNGNVIFE